MIIKRVFQNRTAGSDHPSHENIQSILRIEEENQKALTAGERISRRIARFAGSLKFIVIHVLWFSSWCLLNLGWIPGIEPFDPFPFFLLSLAVSVEVSFLTIFLLMNQNSMNRQAEQRSHLELQVNILAEQEATQTLQMIRRISEHLGVEVEDLNTEQRELEKKTDVHELHTRIKDTLPDK